MMLTGRYKLRAGSFGKLVLQVEEHGRDGFVWRDARQNDLKAIEPTVADGWRFPEERTGILMAHGEDAGRRYSDWVFEYKIRSMSKADVRRRYCELMTKSKALFDEGRSLPGAEAEEFAQLSRRWTELCIEEAA